MNRIMPFFKCFRVVFFIFIPYDICYPATFSGIVVDKENVGKPIPGVLVSAGHTLIRTLTDAQGHFAFNAPLIPVSALNSAPSRAFLSISWDKRKRIMDFSKAAGITAISIFSLNGSRLFHTDIRMKNRLVAIPSMSRGIFILRVVFNDNSTCSWKWTVLEGRGVFNVPLPSRRVLGKAAAEDGEALLLFRHDDYIPCDIRLGSSAEDLVITMRPDPSRIVFDRTQIHSYHFTVTHEDSLSMERNAFDEQYVSTDFSFDTVAYGKVGLRFKGSKYYLLRDCFDSLGRVTSNPQCGKVSMKVKFDKYNDSARFFSLKRLNLHAMADDGSKMREMVCYKLYRDMGIYASKTAYAKLYINGSFWGIFLAVEELDGRFTKSRWPTYGDGNLYKEVWPNHSNRLYFEAALQTNSNPEDSASGKRMVNFCMAIVGSSKETFVQNISPFMDLDYWLRYIAVDRAIHNADGIMTWYCDNGSKSGANHNFYFYEEENPGGRIWIIPWDLPATLTKTDMIIDDYNVPDWNITPKTCDAVPIWGGGFAIPPNCDKLTKLTAASLWDGFVGVGEQLLSTCMKADRQKQEIDTYASLIEPVVAQDSTIDAKRWQSEVKDLRATMDVLNQGFDDYIHGKIQVMDTSGFDTPFPDSGCLLTDRVNNFEFTPVVPLSSWTSFLASSGSTISLSLDTVSPLWGKSDLLCSFTFLPLDTAKSYAEWAYLSLGFKNEKDLKSLKRIRMHLKCDSQRYCWIYLWSESYKQHNVEDNYGWHLTVGTSNEQYTFEMSKIAYPSWGNPDNPDILDTVLASVSAIGANPNPRFNNSGKLSVVPDSGYIRVDNIIFEY